jgi:phosphatidylinositol alpha-1,6-mannosyltransferase
LKRVVLISSEFPPLPGGIGNHAINLARQLTKKKYQVVVCTDQRSKNLCDDIRFDRALPFTVRRVKRYSLGFLTYVMRFLTSFGVLNNQEVKIVFSSGKFSLWLGAVLKLVFKNKKYIGVLHGSELLTGNKMQQKMTKWSLTRFDSLIAVSNFTKETALELDNLLSIKVINNGFLPDSDGSNGETISLIGFPKIVTVGNVTFRKGQQNVIKAMPELKNIFPEIHYHVVGIPTEQEAFQKLANELGVSDAITFHGAVSNNKLKAITMACDIFAMLSQKLPNGDVEGFGIAILEANALGIPSVGSSDSGIADAISNQFSGKLVLPNDSQAIQQAIIEIMENYQKYSINAKQWSRQFEWDIVIDKYLEVIKK